MHNVHCACSVLILTCIHSPGKHIHAQNGLFQCYNYAVLVVLVRVTVHSSTTTRNIEQLVKDVRMQKVRKQGNKVGMIA